MISNAGFATADGRERSPVPSTSFLGREAELVEGERLLAGTRLLTVTGPGGAGKTRYALELARRAEPRYRDGATACLFASLRDPTLVLPTIAQALSVREEAGRSALEAVVARLEGQRRSRSSTTSSTCPRRRPTSRRSAPRVPGADAPRHLA